MLKINQIRNLIMTETNLSECFTLHNTGSVVLEKDLIRQYGVRADLISYRVDTTVVIDETYKVTLFSAPKSKLASFELLEHDMVIFSWEVVVSNYDACEFLAIDISAAIVAWSNA